MATVIEGLLTLKKWAEDEAKGRFALALKELAMEEDRLYGLEESLRQLEANFSRYSQADTDIEDIKKNLEYQEALIRQIATQRQRIADKERVLEKIRQELVETTKEKKIFERLLEKQQQQELKRSLKIEQSQGDEIASTRYWFNEET